MNSRVYLMSRFIVLTFCVVFGMGLLGCGERIGGQAETARLYEMERGTKALTSDSSFAEAERAAERALVFYAAHFAGFGERAAADADTLAAKLYARLAFARFQQGDTTGAAGAYSQGLGLFYLLPDSARADRLRRVAYTAGLVEPERGWAMLTRLEQLAVEESDTAAFRLAIHCKDELARQTPRVLGVRDEQDRGSAGLGVPLAVLLLALAAGACLCGFYYEYRVVPR